MQSVSELHVYERNLYTMQLRTPLEHGVLDPRLVRRMTQCGLYSGPLRLVSHTS